MELSDLLLKPDELKVKESCFQVPIHPLIVHYPNQLETPTAKQYFHQAIHEWKKELTTYIKSLDPSCQEKREEKEWITRAFLKPERFKKQKFRNEQYGPFENNTQEDERNFSGYISIGRNLGSIYFHNTEEFHTFPYRRYLNLSEEKLKEYQIPHENNQIYTHKHHNIDHFPQALLLKTWAMIYLNQVLTEIHQETNLNH